MDLHIDNIKLDNADYFALRKLMIINIFFYIASLVLVSFTIINFFVYEEKAVVLIDAMAALVSFYALYLLKKNKKINLIVAISSANIFIFFLAYIYVNQNVDYGLIWTIFLPIFIIPLNGHKKGLIISIVFYVIAFFMAYQGIGVWDESNWNFHSFLRFSVSSLVLVYIIHATELSIFKSNTLLIQKEQQERLYTKQLQQAAEIDYLTKIYNRGKITKVIQDEIIRAKRYNIDLSISILDIDFFKRINDTYGHNIGDDVLKKFAQILKTNLRKTDTIGRWGGEEFIILLTHTNKDEAFNKIKDICQKIQNTSFDQIDNLTCSAGISQLTNDITTIKYLIAQADDALYKAKNNGRNRVEIITPRDS